MKLVKDGDETVLRVAIEEVALVFTEHGMFAHLPPGFDPKHDDAPDHIPHHISMALLAMLVVENYGELVGLIEGALSAIDEREKQPEPTLEEAVRAVIKSMSEDIQEA
jgi:hypothetical protein